MLPDWFNKEEEALQKALDKGEITFEKYQAELREMRRDFAAERYRDDMRESGRGHLLSDKERW